jgi:hypothetical protein
MHFDDMIRIIAALFPGSRLVEESGHYTIVTDVPTQGRSKERLTSDDFISMAAALCECAEVEYDNHGQAIIYTGYNFPDRKE